jgi:hypothetical protein
MVMAHTPICPCPNCRGGGGWLVPAAAVLTAAAAVAVFIVTHLWLVLGGLVLVAAGTYALQRLLLRHTVLERPGRGPQVSRAALPAPAPARAISAARPRAIEAPRRVIPAVVISSKTERRRR